MFNPPTVKDSSFLAQRPPCLSEDTFPSRLGTQSGQERIEALSRCIRAAYASDHSAGTTAEIRALFGPFLIAPGSTFPHARSGFPLPSYRWGGLSPISVAEFDAFLKNEGTRLVDEYKEWKWRGRTGCSPISDEAERLLNAAAKGRCAKTEGISHHVFNLVLVEEQPWVLDFTFDQFLDYERVRNYLALVDEPVSYAGVLLVPVDRLTFKFDKQGRLVGSA